jgi:hypothetical protein
MLNESEALFKRGQAGSLQARDGCARISIHFLLDSTALWFLLPASVYSFLSFIRIKTLFPRKRATLSSAFSGWVFSHNVAWQHFLASRHS